MGVDRPRRRSSSAAASPPRPGARRPRFVGDGQHLANPHRAQTRGSTSPASASPPPFAVILGGRRRRRGSPRSPAAPARDRRRRRAGHADARDHRPGDRHRAAQPQCAAPAPAGHLAVGAGDRRDGLADVQVGGSDWTRATFTPGDIADRAVKTINTTQAFGGLIASLLQRLDLRISVLGLTVSTSPVTAPLLSALSGVAPALDGILEQVQQLAASASDRPTCASSAHAAAHRHSSANPPPPPKNSPVTPPGLDPGPASQRRKADPAQGPLTT